MNDEFTCAITGETPASLPATPFSHFQSGAYAGMLRRLGKRPLWLVVSDASGETVATWLLFFSPGDALRPPKHRISRALDVHLHGVHGPVLSAGLSDREREAVLGVLLGGLLSHIRRRRPVTNRFSLDPALSSRERELWSAAAKAAGFRTEASHTYAVRLPESEEELFQKIKSDRRTKVRKAQKSDPVFEEAGDMEALKLYHEVRTDTMRRNGHEPVPFEHFRDAFEELHEAGIYRVFLARFGERIGAGQTAFVWNGYVNLSGVSIATWALDEKLPANDYLQWSVLLWAQKRGCGMVDFVGAQPGSTDPKIKAIDAFKSRWGTELCESLVLTFPLTSWRGCADTRTPC